MDTLIIFAAKYLFLASLLFTAYFLFKSPAELRQKIVKFGLFSLPLTYLMGLAARMLYYNPRPFFEENFAPLIPHLADNGFPSDHTLLLAGLATLIYFFDRKLSIPLWVITILVALARILAGVHHLLDIVASIVIALISGYLVYFVLKHQEKV